MEGWLNANRETLLANSVRRLAEKPRESQAKGTGKSRLQIGIPGGAFGVTLAEVTEPWNPLPPLCAACSKMDQKELNELVRRASRRPSNVHRP